MQSYSQQNPDPLYLEDLRGVQLGGSGSGSGTFDSEQVGPGFTFHSTPSPASARSLRSGSASTDNFETTSRGSRSSRHSRFSNLSGSTQVHQNTKTLAKNSHNGPSPTSITMHPHGENTANSGAGTGEGDSYGKKKKGGVFGAVRNSLRGNANHSNSNNTVEQQQKLDKKVAAYILKCKDELAVLKGEEGRHHADTTRLTELLTKIRTLLDTRVEQGNVSLLSNDMSIGTVTVDIMREYPTNDTMLMEECTCILYFLSILQPDFKKGVARLFKAMSDHKSNTAIQRAGCEAIRNVVQANPDALSRIAPSLGVILQSMAAHGSNTKLIFKSLELLADLALEPISKPLFVQKGGVGLLHILTAMNRHSSDASIQAAGCRSVCNLSLGATREVLQRLTPALDVVLRAMNRHDDDKYVQLYGTWALGNLVPWHHAEIVHQGGVDAILPNMRERLDDGRLQEQSCTTLAKLVEAAKDTETRVKYVDAICLQDGIRTILESMTQHVTNQPVQLQGLSVLLGCVSHSLDHHEIFLSEGGLDVMIRALTTFDTDVPIATKGMELLKNFTRQSLDFQRAVFAKGGIGVVVSLMKLHREAHAIQDPGFACLRNIAIHPENRLTVAQQGGIPVLITNMQIYIGDAAIQAYGCDALGRLVTNEVGNLVLENEGMEIALLAMTTHPNHPGVQDRAIFLLLQMSMHENALVRMKEIDALDTVVHARIPQKEASLERCEQLIQVLQRRGLFGFGRR